MGAINLDTLLAACSAGGSSALSSVTPLRPAGGEMAAIAPAKYAARQGTVGTYVISTRYVDGEPWRTVLIDSSQSQSNRVEQALMQQIIDGNPVLSRIPRIRVTYKQGDQVEQYTDLDLPHRAFDAHIRAGLVAGTTKPVTEADDYRAARNSSPANAWGLLNLSPASLVFGSWDSTRKTHQGRWAAALTGETVGVLTDQNLAPTETGKGGARVDPVGMSVQLSKKAVAEIAARQKDELSESTYESFLKGGQASVLGFGGIPPTLGQLGLVSCRQITRSRVLSFATLRQIRFGKGAAGDAALRSVLAAIALNGIARADAELFLRAHCHLVEAGPSVTEVDRRHGQVEAVSLPEPEEADSLLAAALDHAAQVAELDWHGQVFEVDGDPAILAGSVDDSGE
ncbi:MAG: type I-U CRISPR-associated protein Cas7 [Propionibacteriaceae bacterium]|jgi:CRISPR-associated protein Csb1|nr:type I-U CRISPR-associated protein Cas7 [Propionibacteriaceae bacterium]